MKNYVGIDLGTTNSAISSFDGENIRLYKSPEQTDVTPSAIFIDKRGNKFIGTRAYNNSARNPDSSAILFKRLVGTSTPIKLSAVDLTMSPEECSAEVLRTLFGYLSDDIRNDPDTGTVITVPAAFNQMQKDATMSAAEMAGIGQVALMQEPVAAVMSVMQRRKGDGIFLIFDLGGGTLDIAIAESISGRVSLLSHGGIAMCGGRDFDRILLDNIAKPWLLDKFNLPENFSDYSTHPQYKPLMRVAAWAVEQAKIELSDREESIINLDESELRVRDESGEEIYIDLPITRSSLDNLIDLKIDESIQAAREALEKAGLSPHDVERIVFVGGPTNYQPLREKVAFELGIAASTDVNPMTAVSEGAAVFAESIDWGSKNRSRKSSRGKIQAGSNLDVDFNYISRTPEFKAKIAAKVNDAAINGHELQIDSLDTGWSSGRMPLENGLIVEVPLGATGKNTFKIHVFDSAGGPISLENDNIIITKTAASIDAIPASSSICFEVLDKLGGRAVPEVIVKEGEQLPKKGSINFKSTESLKAGGSGSINFKIWEGDIEPITDNRFVGEMSITGSDFDEGIITAGADLICEYEILDSGNIIFEVSVPSIGNSFQSGRNFYTREGGAIDFSSASKRVIDEAQSLQERVTSMASKVDNPKLDKAAQKIDQAASVKEGETDPETAKQAMDNVLEAKKLLAQVRKSHLKEIRQLDLDNCLSFFDEYIRQYARSTEENAFDNLVKTAQRSIDNNSSDFEIHLDELRGRNFQILWRQDWFVVDRFKMHAEESYLFPDKNRHAELVTLGHEALKNDDIDKLRQVVAELASSKIGSSNEDDMLLAANIVRG